MMSHGEFPWIQGIRRFNRFYTNILGLLDQHLLDTEFSLAETRVLCEIGHRQNITAKRIREMLQMDPGYLSRMLRGFERQGLINRVQSTEDRRSYYLFLTAEGRMTLSDLEVLANRQISGMFEHLPGETLNTVIQSMESIEHALTEQETKVTIRTELRPGDIGYLIHLHGRIYADDCGYNHQFEGYVCKTFYDFLENYHPEKDRLWFAEAGGLMIGAIAIVGHTATRAQLRWFLLHPSFRGRGLGSRLMKEALQFCRNKGYQNVFLLTTADQKTAISMYTKAGFKKVSEQKTVLWGKELVEQTYEAVLDPSLSSICIRTAQKEDEPFLWDMLYHSLFVPPGHEPYPRDIVVNEPEISMYLDGWGRPGDVAVIAETANGKAIGAATARLFSASAPGFGYISDEIPELGIALLPEYRSMGIGTRLMKSLLHTLKERGVNTVSLSVDLENPAVRLYRRLGFQPIANQGSSMTMVLDQGNEGNIQHAGQQHGN